MAQQKPLLLCNIYRVYGELDLTTPLTREPRSIMVGHFNTRDLIWSNDHTRAGHPLNDQLQNHENFCLMNHQHVWIALNKTAIDHSLISVDMVPIRYGSIYHGLVSDPCGTNRDTTLAQH